MSCRYLRPSAHFRTGPLYPFFWISIPIDIGILAKKSLKITRTGLFTHIGDFNRCQEMAKVLFGKVVSGDVKIQIDQTFSLNDIASAHDSLEARKTTGSTVITI